MGLKSTAPGVCESCRPRSGTTFLPDAFRRTAMTSGTRIGSEAETGAATGMEIATASHAYSAGLVRAL